MAHVSKAHLNPAVTFSLVVIGDLNLPLAGVYIVSQVIGATLGYGVLMVSQSTPIEGTQNTIQFLYCDYLGYDINKSHSALIGTCRKQVLQH